MHNGRKREFSSIVHPFFVLGLKLRNLTFLFYFLPPPLQGEISRIYVEDVSCVEK